MAMYAYLSCMLIHHYVFPFHATLVTVFASCYHDNSTTVKRTKAGRSKSAPFSDYLGNLLLFPSRLRFSLFHSSTGFKNCTNVVAKNFILITLWPMLFLLWTAFHILGFFVDWHVGTWHTRGTGRDYQARGLPSKTDHVGPSRSDGRNARLWWLHAGTWNIAKNCS